MQKMIFSSFLALSVLTIAYAQTEEIVVRIPVGEHITIDVNPNEPFCVVVEKIGEQLGTGSSLSQFRMDYKPSEVTIYRNRKASNVVERNYQAPLAETEKSNITYILTTLAKKSPARLWQEETKLRKKGDKINHLHPFRFLSYIFTNKELLPCIITVTERKLVWREFKKGLYDTLTEESGKNNLVPHLEAFAATVKVNSALLFPSIYQKNWDELVSVLIKNVPPIGETNRYNM